MPLFRRNKDAPLIPPVAPAGGAEPKADPYAQAPTSNRYGGGDPYATPGGNRPSGGDPYARSKGNQDAGDPYARSALLGGAGGASGGNPYAKDAVGPDQAARNELFAGYTPAEPAKPAREYGYEGREMEEDFDEDEEIEGIKQEMRGVKQESLASTRNALRLAREAEENARGTISQLADQSERIANSERYLDMAKANNQRAEDKAAELKQLNKSIFRPVIVWNKDAKIRAQEEKIDERHAMERVDRAKALQDVTETRRRLGGAANPRPGYSHEPLPGQQRAKKDARARYQFEATASDDELEDELDENLDETYEVTKRLKNLATAMGDEVNGQNNRLGRITDKTENLEFAVIKNTERLKRIR